jgi:O-antigen/teichoic acid export membrane protein
MSVVAVFTLLASGVNYASNLVFSRLLDPIGFGELTTLLALAVIIVIPTGAAQTVIAERIASHAAAGNDERVRYLVRHAIAHVGLIALVIAAVVAAAVPFLQDVLDLRQPGPLIATAVFVFFAFLQPVALGVLQGLERYTAFGAMQLAIAVSRVGLGVPWVIAGGGAGGAIGGQALGVAVVLAGTAWLTRDLILGRGSGAAKSGLRRRLDVRTVSASGAFVAFAVLSNLDLLLAKLFLSPVDVGIYAAIATVGKIVLFLPMAVSVVLVPNAAKTHREEGSGAAVLRVAAMAVVGSVLLAAIPMALFPGTVVNLMFGSEYAAAADGVLPIVIAGGALAMVYLLVVYVVAIADRRWGWLLALGVALQVGGIAAFHGSPAEVATVQAIVAVVVLLVNEVRFHSIIRRRIAAG